MKLQKLKELRRDEHYYLRDEVFQRLDGKEQGHPRTLGNRKEPKELAISKAQKMCGQPELFGRQEKNRQ